MLAAKYGVTTMMLGNKARLLYPTRRGSALLLNGLSLLMCVGCHDNEPPAREQVTSPGWSECRSLQRGNRRSMPDRQMGHMYNQLLHPKCGY